jgi:hypothetical protein
MKLNPLWILLVFSPAMSAQVIPCNAGALSVPVFNPTSISGEVGDYTLDCTGGTVSPPIQIDFYIQMNVPVLNTGGWILSEGGNMTAGTLYSSEVIEFVGVPFIPPGAGDGVFQVENIFVNPSAEPPGFQFTGTGSIFGNVSIDIPNQQQVVAENAVPEPFSLVFVGLGMGAMWLGRKRR